MTVSITSNHNRDIGTGQTGNLAHNRRDFTPKNVDPELIKNNIVFRRQTLGDGYDECFSQSIKDYNSKQTRKDRKRNLNYFKFLFSVDPDSEIAQKILTSNARGKHEIKSFNEDLFQVGDCYEFGHFLRDYVGNLIDKKGNPVKWDSITNSFSTADGKVVDDSSNLQPNPKAEIAKEILSAFYTGGKFMRVTDKDGNPTLFLLDSGSKVKADFEILGFEERNSNFHVVDASMHNDEWNGTPHIHIDYIPIGTGYLKGPDKQVGFERALEKMGFTDKRSAYKEWREKEREILKTICREYGLETKTKLEEQKNNRGKTYAPDIYAQAERDGRAKGQETAQNIIEQANDIKEQAINDAQITRKQAESEAKDTRRQAIDEADSMQQKTQEQHKQLDILFELSAKMPKKKLFSFGSDKYEMDKNEYDDLMSTLKDVKQLSHNTLTSNENKQALENERKRLEQLRKEEEQRIQQQAEQLANEIIRQKVAELKEKQQEYELLIKKQKANIITKAKILAEKQSATFRKLDNEEKIRRLERSLIEMESTMKSDENDLDFTLK